MKKALPFLLLAASTALFSSCITDDYDYGYGNGGYYNGGYYNDRPPPPPRYDNRYYRDDRDYRDYRDDRYYRDDRHRDDRHHDRRQGSPTSQEFQASGSAKEFAFPAGNSRCTITVVDGSVGFKTVVIRNGGAKRSQTINATFQRGQSFDVHIDRDSTGLRISDTGRGRYRVSVR